MGQPIPVAIPLVIDALGTSKRVRGARPRSLCSMWTTRCLQPTAYYPTSQVGTIRKKRRLRMAAVRECLIFNASLL